MLKLRLGFALGWLALVSIMTGIAVIRLPTFDAVAFASLRRTLGDRSVVFALLAALATAGYTVWDKRSVQSLQAFFYFYSYTVLVGLVYGAYLIRRWPSATLRAKWRTHRACIDQPIR